MGIENLNDLFQRIKSYAKIYEILGDPIVGSSTVWCTDLVYLEVFGIRHELLHDYMWSDPHFEKRIQNLKNMKDTIIYDFMNNPNYLEKFLILEKRFTNLEKLDI